MKTFTVKQIKFNEVESEYPNEFGWDGAVARSEKWRAKMDYMHFQADEGDVFKQEDIDLYNDTFLVQAESLDHVFHLTNMWNDMDKVHMYEQGHSTSVGDLIVDNATGDTFIVAGFGFDKVA
jgi:hypothetical protein